jgi:tetratricopeptide (TPR) repeat protein
MPLEPHEDTIRPVLDSVQPFVSRGDFASACGLVSKAIAESLNAGRSEDAATLSSILASFLSISGANESALEAFERAEILDPANLHHSLATARHRLTKLKKIDTAEEKALTILKVAGNDYQLIHTALTVLGQCALAKGNLDKAASYLRQAQNTAIEGDIHPSTWDYFLVDQIARIDAKNETGRAYAQNLLDRARAHSHAITEKRARTLLSCFAPI